MRLDEGGELSRREFLKDGGALVGGALVLAWGGGFLRKLAFAAGPTSFEPNPFIAIHPDGRIILLCHRSEMGQGARTAMAMLLAEELEVKPEAVTLAQGDGDERYGDQNTDGSHSVADNWTRLREAGAAAREMLIAAAAKRWGVEPADCKARNGSVHNGSRAFTYGELAADAAALPLPKKPRLKPDSALTLLGKDRTLLDVDAITSGKAIFGIDVVVPGMVYASLERAPAVNGTLKSADTAAPLSVPGVLSVVKLPPLGNQKRTNHAIAVVATNTWAARQGRLALKAEWESHGAKSTPELRTALEDILAKPAKVYRHDGNFEAASHAAARTIEARYRAPHLAHAPMEPLNCVAHVKSDGSCEIWVPTQDPQGAQKAAAEVLGVPISKVTVHVALLGGAFGRKSIHDYVMEAAALSKELKKPVKTTWTREDEIRHGFYHPESAQLMTATLDGEGNITGWRHRSVFTPIARLFNPAAEAPNDFELGMGATNMPYGVPSVLIEGAAAPTEVRIAWLRSVCNIFHAFAVNSFIDEIAHETKRDPVKLRLDLLKTGHVVESARLAHVTEIVARESGWGKTLPKGTGMGVACHFSFKSYVACAIEARVAKGAVKVTRVHVAIDCGKVVNTDTVRAQMEGAVVFGLSGALKGEITLKDGAVEQSNFHDYEMLRLNECPEIRVHLVKSDAAPTGVGEPGVPPVAPALCGAIFQATGRRIRDLPISKSLRS
jgi:isoquinoline 1-oxidoreductase beta subunit